MLKLVSIEEEAKRAGGPGPSAPPKPAFLTENDPSAMRIREQNLELGEDADAASARSVSSYASNRLKENDYPPQKPQFKLKLVEYEGGDASDGSKLSPPPKPPRGRLSPINPRKLKSNLQLPPLQMRGSGMSRLFKQKLEKNMMSNETNNSLVHSHRDDPLSWHAGAHQSSISLQQF